MDSEKVRRFMELAGQRVAASGADEQPDARLRALGAQLLLSETLEYIIHGLGITPIFGDTPITDPNRLEYRPSGEPHSRKEMLDGLSDVAYTMYWNALAFGLPLEEAFDLVSDNNLEKFVKLGALPTHRVEGSRRLVDRSEWSCGTGVEWPPEVATVELIETGGDWYAVGKDGAGKVRKPSSYRSVDLSGLLSDAA